MVNLQLKLYYCSLMNAKTPNIANTETDVSTNRQFSVFYFLQFHKNNLQTTHILVTLTIKNVDKIKQTLKSRFIHEQIKHVKRVLRL